MTKTISLILAGWLCLACPIAAPGDEQAKAVGPPTPSEAPDRPAEAPPDSIEQLVEDARKSVTVVYFTNRDGEKTGVGTGFVVDSDGLVATNLHVIGEARPIFVRLADGRAFEAAAVHASDRSLDLAVLRIDAKDLPALPLGDSDTLKQGQAFLALGNPHGLVHSVVHGVVSGIREIDDRPMIQLAMPMEPGNSGGPVLDLRGRVQGIVTLKSAIAANLGFAVPINQLKALLDRPNPIPMNRWLTIGAIDPDEWQPLLGAYWRQRAGRIVVNGRGEGFGGRSLLLSKRPASKLPLEISVTVRLDDESGAAGLAFYADGHQKHYGFYPSNGNLRLSRFDGSNVSQWNVLDQVESPHYRPGDWNTLKVHLGKGRVSCFVNDHLVIGSTDTGYTEGRIGLVKFRHTRAQFRKFMVGKNLPSLKVSDRVVARITKQVKDLPDHGELPHDLIDALLPRAEVSQSVLNELARILERQSSQLSKLATAVHRKHIQARIVEILEADEQSIDLFHAALLIAKMDNHEVDVEAYRKELEQMARELEARMPDHPDKVDDQTKIATLNQFLFQENGYHGSRTDYYNRSNSYLNEVLDDREGLPITLSVLYMELCNRIGFNVVGAALPGHFMVRHVPPDCDLEKIEGARFIDVFDGGQILSCAQAAAKIRSITGIELADMHLKPATKREIILRMLRNLMGAAGHPGFHGGALVYLDAILAIAPESASERSLRAFLGARTGRYHTAIEDTRWLLKVQPPGIDLERVRQLHDALRQNLLPNAVEPSTGAVHPKISVTFSE